MKKFCQPRLRGAGCNSSRIKHKVSDWRKRYDQSRDYRLSPLKRLKKPTIKEME